MAKFSQISYSDTGALDAFSRLRTSQPNVILSIQSQYDANPIQMEAGATGTGVSASYSTSTRMVQLSATSGSGTSFIQTYQYSPYQPGHSQFIGMTGVLGTGVNGCTKDFGYFDSNNGVIYRQNGTGSLQFILRTSTGGSVSDANIVNQSAWTLDKMNGTGPSGITLDVTKAFILIIDLQVLGMGRVRVGFDVDGIICYAHQFVNANNLTVPCMQTATLPIGVVLTSTASTTANCYFKCATVQSEGGTLDRYGYGNTTPETTVTAGNGTRVPLVAVRPKTTFNGITNRTLFILDTISIFVTGNMDIQWELVVGGNYSGQTWADVATGFSAFEYTSVPGAYTNLTGGVVITSGYASRLGGGNNGQPIAITELQSLKYPISLDRVGNVRAMGTLTLLVSGNTAASACRGNLNFKEIR